MKSPAKTRWDSSHRTKTGGAMLTNLEGNALNVYLVDLRENRQLRSNERVREAKRHRQRNTSARRVDCHYLITAWSPAVITPAVEPTLDEHSCSTR